MRIADWLQDLARHSGVGIHDFAVATVGLVNNEVVSTVAKLVAPLLVMALSGTTAWLAGSVIDLRTQMAAQTALSEERQHKLAAVERKLSESEQRLLMGMDDRWRRRDHDAYAQQVDARLAGLDQRLNVQRADILEMQRREARSVHK